MRLMVDTGLRSQCELHRQCAKQGVPHVCSYTSLLRPSARPRMACLFREA